MFGMTWIHGLGPIRTFHLVERLGGPRVAIGFVLIILLIAIVLWYRRKY